MGDPKYIWMDDKLVDCEKATVHFLTPALHYGAAVFEGIRAYSTDRGAAVFRLKEHAERLVDSAMVLGFRSLPWNAIQIADAIKQTVKANGFSECYIRPLIYLGGRPAGLNLDGGPACLGIAAWEWNN